MPPPTTVNDIYAAAILSVLDDIKTVLDRVGDRLASSAGDIQRAGKRDDGAVPLQEPGVPGQRPAVEPQPEPANEPEPEPEPDQDEVLPDPPPRAGRGSSLDAWKTWAALAHVQVDDDMTRDDIVAACELAGVIEPDTRRT